MLARGVHLLDPLLGGLIDLALPPRCGACGSWQAAPLCDSCRHSLEPDLDFTQVPHLDDCVAAVAYAGPMSDWMQRFKYPRAGFANLDAAPLGVLRSLIEEATHQVRPGRADCVIPVPLHPRRLRQRGFNPALLLAQRVARISRTKLAARGLERVLDTPSQTGLDRGARRRNVSGAFACVRSPIPERVWLIDDVLTTGATVSECARVLKRNGARQVTVICVARTPLAQEQS